jgi:Polysulphide reductase
MMLDTYHKILVFASSITPSRPWGVNIPNYFWTGGISVGAFFIYSLYTVFGIEKFKRLASMCILIAFSFIAIAPLNLVDDLKQPGRMIHVFLYGWSHFPTSPMKWGVILLTTYTILTLLSLVAYYRPFFVSLYNSVEDNRLKLVFKLLTLNRLELTEEAIKKDRKILFYLGAIGLLFGIGVEFYTGYIVGILVAFPLVHFPALPLVMLASALVSGSGFVLFFYPIYQKLMGKEIDRDDIAAVANIMAWAIVGELILDLFWYSFSLAFSGITKYYMRAYFKEDLIGILVFDLGLFLFVPMILAFSKAKRSSFIMFVAGALAAFGAWYFKYSLVIGGQSFPKMIGGFLTYTMPIFGHNSLQSLIANWSGIIGLLAATIALLPHTDDLYKGFGKEVKG